ncbi:MAG: SPOR domain-containing protein [Spirochaetaceae bacterium]|jgi:cell division septation protein DedD|nr:SPOR domain-containing protein [Spirochaetaceae bacterium]
MVRKKKNKKVIAFALFFLSAYYAYSMGSAQPAGGGVPKLEVSTIDARTRLIRFDWSAVDYPEEYRFGLYRLDRSNRTNVFLKEIVKTDVQFADSGLTPPLYNYFYVVESVGAGEELQERKNIRTPTDKEIARQTISAYYIDVRNPQYWVDEETPSYNERLGETDLSPRPPAGRRTTQVQPLNEGVYIGLIGFSGKVKEITKDPVLIPLDPAGRQELMDKLNVAYTKSSDFGSAPYYAIHTALANLSREQKEGRLPRNVENVTVITFTDGLDVSSTDSSFEPLEGKDFRPKSGGSPEEYKNYIISELKTRKIAGKNIDAWTIGVEGKNVKNNWTFTQLIREMSTDSEHYAVLSDIKQLEWNLSSLADVFNIYTSLINVTFTTPSYPVGTTVRITFDGEVGDPNKARYWIEGDVDWVNGKYVLTNLCSNGVRLGDAENVLGLRTSRGIEYTIRLNDDFYEANMRQWQLPPDVQNLSSNWVLIHDFFREKSMDLMRTRKSSIIYLILDCNPSLKNEEINSIRGAVQSFIEKLYAGVSSGVKIKPIGSVPLQQIAAVKPPSAVTGAKNKEPPDKVAELKENEVYTPGSAQNMAANEAVKSENPNSNSASAITDSEASSKDVNSFSQNEGAFNGVKTVAGGPLAAQTQPDGAVTGTGGGIFTQQGGPQSKSALAGITESEGAFSLPPPEYQKKSNSVNSSSANSSPAGAATVGRTPPALTEDWAGREPPSYFAAPKTEHTPLRGPVKAPRYTDPEKGYWVQLGSYLDLIRAQRLAAPVLASGFTNLEIFAKEINGALYYRIKMGPYSSRAEADYALIQLGRSSLPISEGFVVRE